MVRKAKEKNKMAAEKKSRNEVKVATNASFFYMFLWMLAAIGAITYIALLANHSLPDYLKAADRSWGEDLKTDLSAGANSNTDALAKLASSVTDTNHNLRQLNVKYYALENRLNNINNRITLIQEAGKGENVEANQRISRLDDPELNTGTIKKIDQPPETEARVKEAKTKIALPITKSQSKTLPEAELEGGPKQIAATKIIEHGNKALDKQNQALKKQPATPTIMRTMFAVSLGHYPDLNNLKTAWKVLKKKHGAALGDLKPRYITLVVDNKPVYQLVSGPLTNALDAAKICNYLQQLKTYCRQTVFHGSDI